MDEILVHIAAPSTAHDDARYRAQVAAILDFQSASRYPIQIPDQDHPTHLLSADPTLSHERSREASRPAFSDHSHEYPDPRENDPIPVSNREREFDSLDSLISVIPDSQEIATIVSSQSAEILDPPSKRPCISSPSPSQSQSPYTHTHTHAESTTDQPAAQQCSPAIIDSTLSIDLPLEIHPPKPPISTAPFKTNITPTLSMLTERLKPARTYNPTHQTRDLDPLERGYWFVRFTITDTDQQDQDRDRDPVSNPDLTPSPIWPAPLFRAFWSFLSDFIGRDGRAGWGVWCILERDGPLLSSRVTLKVYAWGEVAMHVYLLLFLASERRIRGMGVQWRDYREEVVVQMP